MRIALFEPDIPQNTGTILRLAACLGVEAHLIEPAGFPTSDRAFRRAGMDYLDQVTLVRHVSWEEFERWRRTEGPAPRAVHHQAADLLPRSRLSSRATSSCSAANPRRARGGPRGRRGAAEVPLRAGLRSLNVAMTCAMAVGEALRQTGGFPDAKRALAAG